MQLAVRLTWVIPLQQVPAVERSAFGVAHLQALLQQPLGDVALADACELEARRITATQNINNLFTSKRGCGSALEYCF